MSDCSDLEELKSLFLKQYQKIQEQDQLICDLESLNSANEEVITSLLATVNHYSDQNDKKAEQYWEKSVELSHYRRRYTLLLEKKNCTDTLLRKEVRDQALKDKKVYLIVSGLSISCVIALFLSGASLDRILFGIGCYTVGTFVTLLALSPSPHKVLKNE